MWGLGLRPLGYQQLLLGPMPGPSSRRSPHILLSRFRVPRLSWPFPRVTEIIDRPLVTTCRCALTENYTKVRSWKTGATRLHTKQRNSWTVTQRQTRHSGAPASSASPPAGHAINARRKSMFFFQYTRARAWIYATANQPSQLAMAEHSHPLYTLKCYRHTVTHNSLGLTFYSLSWMVMCI